MNYLKNMKIRVNESNRQQVKSALLAEGYNLCDSEAGHQFYDGADHFYTYNTGLITHSDGDHEHFEQHANQEHFLSPAGFVTADYFKQPETAYCKGCNRGNCVGCGEADKPDVLSMKLNMQYNDKVMPEDIVAKFTKGPTLKPLAQHNHERMLDIISALQAKVERKEKLPSEWTNELLYLNEFVEGE